AEAPRSRSTRPCPRAVRRRAQGRRPHADRLPTHREGETGTTRPARKHYVRTYQTQKGGGEPTMTDQERATVSDARDDLPFIVHSQLDDLDLDPFEFRAYAHMVRRAGLGKNGGAGEH